MSTRMNQAVAKHIYSALGIAEFFFRVLHSLSGSFLDNLRICRQFSAVCKDRAAINSAVSKTPRSQKIVVRTLRSPVKKENYPWVGMTL